MSKTVKIIIFAVVVLAALFAVYWFFLRTPKTSGAVIRTSCRYDVETYVPPPGGVGEGSCVNKITGAESNPV